MASKQQELYTKLTEETKGKVETYKEFAKSIENIKLDSAKRIKSFKMDMKSLAKQIDLNNKSLKSQGQPIVEFKP